MGVIFTEGIFILNYSPSAKRIRIRKPTFLPTCCSSAAAPMLPCPRMNRRPPRRNRSSCGGRMHVLTLTERAVSLCYLAIPRSCNQARESTQPLQLYIYCINICYICYIYIYSIIFYFFTGCACTQPPARRGQRTVALVHYGRERRAVGGQVHRSARAARQASHCSARVARVLHVAH